MPAPDAGLLLAGEVGKPHGLMGEVYVVAISDDPRRFEAGSVLHHEEGRTLTVAASRHHRGRLLVTFEEISTRDEAEGLRGALYVPASEARDLAEDEFWYGDLVGLRVVDPAGTEIGSVTRVEPGSAQDLLVVETSAGERLVPLVKQIVVEVRAGDGEVVVDAPEGLL